MEEEVKFPKKKKKLKKAYKLLVETLYERSGMGTCPKWEGTHYWYKKAGLVKY